MVAYILISGGIETKNKQLQKQTVAVALTESTSTIPFPIANTRVIEPFTYLNLTSKGVIVYDIDNDKVIFSQGKDNILPIASITKLMTIFTASKFLSPETEITITQEDIDQAGDSDLAANERWSFKNLTAFTLITSSNIGATAIARKVKEVSGLNFVSEMNNSANEMGLTNSLFRNSTGLDLSNHQISGANSTAQDIAYLYAYLLENKPELLTDTNKSHISISSLDGNAHIANNTNDIINQITGIIASKTGTTQMAGGNLSIVFNPLPNRRIAIVILGDTPTGRFVDMRKLIKDTVQTIKNQ